LIFRKPVPDLIKRFSEIPESTAEIDTEKSSLASQSFHISAAPYKIKAALRPLI
jgi:hypothetical protein